MEFSFPLRRWVFKGWFFVSAIVFFYLFRTDIFLHRWFILVWSVFSLLLGTYVAPAIRVDSESLAVKYLWRYRTIPWNRVLDVQRTIFGAQILTSDSHWAYRVVGYQYPMPGVGNLVHAIGRHVTDRRRRES